MQWYKRFLEKYGAVGLMMSMAAVSYIAIILLQGLLQEGFDDFYRKLTLPMNFDSLIKQPWSVLTYWLAAHPLAIWFLVIDMVLFYTFGNILNALLGDRFAQGLITFAMIVNALIVVGFANILPTVEITEKASLFGFHLINCTLIGAAITLSPNYQFQIIRWKVPLLYVGIFLLLMPLIAYRAIWTVMGLATVVGPLMGFLLMRAKQGGTDMTRWLQLPIFPEKAVPTTRGDTRIRVRVRERVERQEPVKVQRGGRSNDAEELDRLLDKINEVGYDGLSKKEKETLDRLSKD
jgi:hypothetical protein